MGPLLQINWIFRRIKNVQYSVWNMCACVLITQLWLTLCNPMDGGPPGSSVHEVFQARILEWVELLKGLRGEVNMFCWVNRKMIFFFFVSSVGFQTGLERKGDFSRENCGGGLANCSNSVSKRHQAICTDHLDEQ